MKNCQEDIAFNIKVYGNPFNSMFSGGGKKEQGDGQDYYPDEYQVATEEDMQWLASIL